MKNLMKQLYPFAAFLLPSLLFANPSGPEVIHGDVGIRSDANALHITASDKAIIHWKDFSISPSEITKFIQPSSQASVLNRVTGSQVSSLMGTLEANGKVFLINPNGIIFGKDAIIDTGSFTGSTFDVLDNDFLQNSSFLFKDASANSIINLGKIHASNGNVILIAHRIENEGSISAPKGTVGLAAGAQEILLKPEGKEKIFIRVSALATDSPKEGALLDQKGQISALTAELKTSGNAYAYAIQQQGTIDATAFAENDGKILLVADDGCALVKNQLSSHGNNDTGGEIQLLGKTVILDDATVDASGKLGGGNVYVGGGFQGNTPNLLASEYTYISPSSKIQTNATENGNGGQVVVWSNGMTFYHGKISARGGEISGNGGNVETSGKKHLQVRGGISDVQAPNGKAGNVLWDPEADITVQCTVDPTILPPVPFPSVTTTGTVVPAWGVPGGIYEPGLPADVLEFADIAEQLQHGTLTITTSGSVGGGNGTITFLPNLLFPSPVNPALALVYNSGNALTIKANGHDTNGDGIIFHTSLVNGFSTTTGDIILDTRGGGGNIRMLCGEAGYNSYIPVGVTSSAGNVYVYCNDLNMISENYTGISGQTGASTILGNRVFLEVTGNLTMKANFNPIPFTFDGCFIESRSSLPLPSSFVHVGGNLTMLNQGAKCRIIFAEFPGAEVVVNNQITMQGFDATRVTEIFDETAMKVQSTNGSISLLPFSDIRNDSIVPSPDSDDLLVMAGANIHLYTNSFIGSSSPNGGVVTIVSDNLYPSPLIGSGTFQMDPGSSITQTTGPVRIFCGLSSNVRINATIHGIPFSSGPVLGPNEVLNVWYPSSIGGFPFTIFYKEFSFLSPIVNTALLAPNEVFSYLHPFSEYLAEGLKFQCLYNPRKSVSSSSGFDKYYFTRERAYEQLYDKIWEDLFYVPPPEVPKTFFEN